MKSVGEVGASASKSPSATMSGATPEPPGLKPPPPPPDAAASASSTINPLFLNGASPRGGHMDASASVTAILRLALQKAEEEERSAKGFEAKIGEVPTSIFPLNRYLQYRRKASSLRALCGRHARHVTVDEIDAIVNTLTLVNALLLTIPFGVLGGMSGSQYWDATLAAMQARSDTCLSMTGSSISFEDVFFWTYQVFLGAVYSAIGGILLAIFYFFLRPKNTVVFQQWWVRARWVVTWIGFATASSTTACLLMCNQLVTAMWFFTPSGWICDEHKQREYYRMSMGAAMFVVFGPTMISIILMI
jgi:hypothetical protein